MSTKIFITKIVHFFERCHCIAASKQDVRYILGRMSRLLPIRFEMGYKIEFQAAIRGHHIYKDIWVPLIGQELICKRDSRDEALEYDRNAIGVFKPGNPEVLVGHLPIELSCLFKHFLETSAYNTLSAVVTGKRKREVGLVVPAKYIALTKDRRYANVLFEKLKEKKDKYKNFEFNIVTSVVKSIPKRIELH